MSQGLQSQHTQNFPAALQQLGISIFVSTYQAGKLIVLRNDEGALNTHFIAMEKPMGMALQGPRLSIGSGYQVQDYFNLPAVSAKVPPSDKHDACYLPRRSHVTGDIDIHEMAFSADKTLWLVNTRMSCLCTLEAQYSVVPKWRPPFISAYDLTDRCHLNGLAMKDGEPAYVTALGTTDSPAGWRDNKANGGVIMRVDSGEVIARDLSMPHSPRWYRNKLWVLESGAGILAEVDPKTGERDVIVELPGFTRGLDFVGQYAIIGLSQVRETAIFAGLPLTQRVDERQCGVWIVDIKNRQSIAWVVFTANVQEIFAVQAIPSRFPALLEKDDPLVRRSYSLPDDALAEITPPDPILVQLEQATLQHRNKQYDKAIAAYKRVLDTDPEQNAARYHLGLAYLEQEQLSSAIAELQQVIERQPSHAEAHNSLGNALALSGDHHAALDQYQSAIDADSKYATAHFNYGLTQLMLGNFREGWEGYEWRWQMPEFTPFECRQPQWQGEDIRDKTLLVYTEQGNGDAMQFARFLPVVKPLCRRLLVVCTEPLRQLFQAIEAIDEVRLPGNLAQDSFDVYSPIMSLAKILDITPETIPAAAPYLKVPVHVHAPPLNSCHPLKVGLVWAGSATHKMDRHRSCPLSDFIRLTEVQDVDFFSLQHGVNKTDRELLQQQGVTDLESELIDYAHTAACLQQMDLVISVCTSVAHLSGAFNKPTWILTPPHGEWRWRLSGEHSPWYPSARLFRHPGRKPDWPGVIATAKEALQQWRSDRLDPVP